MPRFHASADPGRHDYAYADRATINRDPDRDHNAKPDPLTDPLTEAKLEAHMASHLGER